MPDKPEIAVLEEEPRKEIPLDPPEPGINQLKRGFTYTFVFSFFFVSVLICATPATVFYYRNTIWPPEVQVGGAVLVLPFVYQGKDAPAETKGKKAAKGKAAKGKKAKANPKGDPGLRLTKGVIDELSKEAQLTVTPLEVAKKYAKAEGDMVSIGKSVGARFVVQGEVRPAEDNVKVSVTLVHVEKGGSVYTERYKGKLSDIGELTHRVSHDIKKGTGLGGD